MLKYLLKEETNESVVYDYFPENGETFGTVSYNKKSNECGIVTLSENDKHQRYALKMFSQIREFASKKSYLKEGIIAWY